MRIELTKGSTADTLEIHRRDGSFARTTFPRNGPVPHDAVHFFVERELGIERGFWGLVAEGHHPEEVGAMAKAAGHASASRCREPDTSFVTAIQAERIVECFEADLWGGGYDPETFIATVDAACEQSLVPTPAIEVEKIEIVRGHIKTFRDRWVALPVNSTYEFDWPEPCTPPAH